MAAAASAVCNVCDRLIYEGREEKIRRRREKLHACCCKHGNGVKPQQNGSINIASAISSTLHTHGSMLHEEEKKITSLSAMIAVAAVREEKRSEPCCAIL